MIKSIRLQNYESHEDSLFELHEGVNVIVGDSEKGKSGSMRGMCGVATNKMFGLEHVSHWCLTKGKEIKAGKECKVTWDKGDVQISRVRSAKINGYEISTLEKPLEAIRNEIPSIVSDALNISEVNIQRQFDAPFLIGRPAGEVARFINKLVRLDDIDLFISAAKERVRKNKEEVEAEVEEIKKLDSSIGAYEWLDKIREYVLEIKTIESELPKLEAQIEQISLELVKYAESKVVLDICKSALRAEPIVGEIRAIDEKIAQKVREVEIISPELAKYRLASALFLQMKGILQPAEDCLNEAKKIDKDVESLVLQSKVLTSEIAQWRKAKDVVASCGNIQEVEALVELAKKITSGITSKLEEFAQMEKELLSYKKAKAEKERLEKEIAVLIASRPKNCPTCGQPLDRCGGLT